MALGIFAIKLFANNPIHGVFKVVIPAKAGIHDVFS